MYAIRVPQTALYVHPLWCALFVIQVLVSSTLVATPPVQTVIGSKMALCVHYVTQNAKYVLLLQLTVRFVHYQGQIQHIY